MFKKSDPANVSVLQKRFLKCLLSKRTIILSYLYKTLNDQNDQAQQNDVYTQMFAQRNDASDLVPAIAASIWHDLQGCTQKFLTDAYKSGEYYVLKKLKKQKPSYFVENLTIQKELAVSYDLIKSSMLNLAAKLYSAALANPEDLKSVIDETLKRTFTLIAVTEAMRQKVKGATNTLLANKVEKVVLKAEYMTAQDSKVCPKCAAYQGHIMSVKELMALLPQHPGCRCWFEIVDYADKNDR